MEQKIIGAGVVALVVGFALGNVTAPKADDGSALKAMIADAVSPATEAMSGMQSDISSELSALSDRLGAMEEQMATPDTSAMDQLGARFDEMTAQMQESMASQRSAMAERMEAMAEEMSAAVSSGTTTTAEETADSDAAATADASEPAPEPETEIAAAPVDDGTPPEGLTPGETAVFADGALRAFVSRVGTDKAQLQINGTMTTLAAGGTTLSGDCLVSLDAVDRGHAQISAACGADMPAAEGFGPGETAMLGEGAARVFVSGITTDGNGARLAINGLDVQTVAMGSAAPAGDEGCSVTVDGIARGHVALSYGCDS